MQYGCSEDESCSATVGKRRCRRAPALPSLSSEATCLQMSVRGSKGEGRVEFKFLYDGTNWQITELRFVW